MKTFAAATALAIGALAFSQAEAASVKNIVLVHGAFADASTFRSLTGILVKDGYHVSLVQEPITSLEDDVATEAMALFYHSIVPPSTATMVAGSFAEALAAVDVKPTYIDFNAISPATMADIASIIRGSVAMCSTLASLAVPPSADGTVPTFYVSGDAEHHTELLTSLQLKARRIDGEIGAASALKMVYAGLARANAANIRFTSPPAKFGYQTPNIASISAMRAAYVEICRWYSSLICSETSASGPSPSCRKCRTPLSSIMRTVSSCSRRRCS